LNNRRVVGKEEDIATQFIQEYPELNAAKGFEDLTAFVASLSVPRKIMLMVNAGESTDDIIQQLIPLLQPGDIVIDGGNAHYLDTEKRIKQLGTYGIQYLGVGVSGGEAGALLGPSIMPGGSTAAYMAVQPILEQIAAINSKGFTCCKFIGAGGAGHFVKMVHNGIEYAEMQLLAELVQFLKVVGGHDYDLIALLLKPYLQGPQSSYLLEITVQILQTKSNGDWILNQILDNAGNKGTGSWTSMEAAKIGLPIPTLTAALNARFISALWRTRQHLASTMTHKVEHQPINIQQVMDAYQLCRIINHHQGFQMIETVSNQHQWGIDLTALAGVWTAGCIIRSKLMEQLQDLLSGSTQLLLHPEMVSLCNQSKSSLKHILSLAIANELPMDAFSASAQYLFALKQAESGAALIQAQRDFFGAHTYQLKNNPEGPFYHFNWQAE
jgi:6-phosphogluconate dehydrogenase